MRIEAVNITKSYNERVLFKSLNYQFKESSITTIIGKNGCGKSTFLKIILGLRYPDGGQIKYFFNDKEIDYDKAKSSIACSGNGEYIIQDFLVLEYFEFLRFAYRIKKQSFIENYKKLLTEFDIKDNEFGKKIKDLSKGYQNLVEIFGALLINPEVIILDEPFSNLDPHFVSLLQKKLLDLKQQNKVIILSAHDEIITDSDLILL